MKKSMFFCTFVFVLSISISTFCDVSAVPTLHWLGLGSGIGGYYDNPPTSGAGYGEVYPHGNWSVEIVFDEVYGLAGYADGDELITFCLEWNEELIGENDFTAQINSGAVNGGIDGTGFDALDAESAWLYEQYITGNTFSIANINRRAAVVQEAIWDFEGELDTNWLLYLETAGVKQMATNAVIGGWVNNNVVVLNIYWASDGRDGQDVLAIIPEPSTIAILAVGAVVFLRLKPLKANN